MRVFNDAFFAKLFHHSVAFKRYWTILNVELLQAPAVIGNTLNANVADHLTTLHTQLLQIWTVFRE